MNAPRPAKRPYTDLILRLRQAGLRPTKQRLALARLMLGKGDWHWTAEALGAEAARAGVRVSLATVYNTLNQFTAAGLMREVVVEPGRSYFDTNVGEHHHVFNEDTGALADLPAAGIRVSGLPRVPEGAELARVDVVVRLRRRRAGADNR
jgi:Fur family transcriptional regulator, iron response regulator